MNSKSILSELPRIAALQNYLEANDWQVVSRSAKYSLYAKQQQGKDVELVVPKDESIAGWQNAIMNSLYSLSNMIGLSPSDVVNAIAHLKYDVIRSKIPDSLVLNDSIDMETAVEFISGLKKLMVSTASAELSKSQSVRRSPPRATEYGKRCRFGHTFKGSFGFTIESPVIIETPPKEPTLLDYMEDSDYEPPEPFERKVVKRLAVGMNHLNQAVQNNDLDTLTRGYELGFNANMLEDLLKIHEAASNSQVMFNFNWSPEIEEKEIENDFGFVLGKEKIDLVQSAAKHLKEKIEPEKESITGFVTDLHTDFYIRTKDDSHDDRKIVIRATNKSFPGRRLYISLRDHDYAKALSAHKSGNLVTVTGIMQKKGMHWYLRQPDSFKIINVQDRI